uniref:Gamma-secretase-activating protein C-terminal domain-containing protein n=1 Tax=Timema monikensis TaxID=170555 RepID=A0A7R9ECW6_9NEOP|nr:unnamed protein product [Timema monikensis]
MKADRVPVLNIPLNLPQLPRSGGILCGVYEDDPVPLRVHDCSLDLQVVSDSKGVVCICHHYLYQPVKPPVQAGGGDMSNTVHFAYSVTLLHHGCVIHCVVPGIPWSDARTMKPTFVLHGDQHMLVYAPGLFTHLLDIGLSHEPCCHILTSPHLPGMPSHVTHLVPLFQTGNNVTTVDLPSLDLVSLAATTAHLVDTFRSDNSLGNRLAILHYFLVHQGDFETVAELLMPVVERPLDLSVSQLLQEVLIGGAYASAQRNLPSDATALMLLLPLTSGVPAGELHVKVNRLSMSVTQEMLWNTAMMLLSPQQRVVPYRADMWTRLWEQLTKKTGKDRPRFRPSQVADKLMVSLVCYQPEALSRSSTPLSPGTSLVGSGTLGELANMAAGGWGKADNLPFFEMESCTASKQEHVISVNLRELSMHLLKNTTKQQTPLHVHVVATQYCAAQLELSRLLCQLLCHCASVDARQEQEYGFALVSKIMLKSLLETKRENLVHHLEQCFTNPLRDQLDEGRRYVLFVLLERFYLAVNSLAFPLPQGFTSFFTFLDMDDTTEGVQRKLRLLLLLPRSRAKRLLNQWVHPVSLMLRAREHALNILSGVEGAQARGHPPQSVRTAQLGSRDVESNLVV